MTDERNDLIRVGDALDAITDWLCDEEFRHHIEPNRKINRFFATVMLENVPRLADRKTEPIIDQAMADRAKWASWSKTYENMRTGYNLLPVQDEPTISKMEQVETMSCQECKRWIFDDRWGWFCPLKSQDECRYEPKNLEQFKVDLEYHTDTTHFGKVKGESITTNKVEDEPQTDCGRR